MGGETLNFADARAFRARTGFIVPRIPRFRPRRNSCEVKPCACDERWER